MLIKKPKNEFELQNKKRNLHHAITWRMANFMGPINEQILYFIWIENHLNDFPFI